jgi:hypothetical protein
LKNKFLEILINIIDRFLCFFRKPLIKAIIIFFIILFSIIYFINNYQQISITIKELEINVFTLSASFVFIILAVFIGSATWWALLTWLGFGKNFVNIIKIYAISTLAKYIPGFVWQYASRLVFLNTSNNNISPHVYGIAVLTEFLLVTCIGGTLAGITYWITGYQFINLNSWQIILLLILQFVFVLIIYLIPKEVKSLLKKNKTTKDELFQKYYIIAIVINLFGWLSMSSSFLLLSYSIGIDSFNFLSATFFHSINFVIGNLFLPFPNGLLIREIVLINLSNNLDNQHLLVFVSMLIRIMIFLSEVFMSLVLYFYDKYLHTRTIKRK